MTYIIKTNYFLDLEPPSINCPDEMTQPTAPGEIYAIIDRPAIEVNDNSGSVPTLVCNHTFTDEFMLGITLVECVATDAANNTARCLLKVIIVGKLAYITCLFLITFL